MSNKAGAEQARAVNEGLAGANLHRGMVDGDATQNTPFRISPEPIWIDRELYEAIEGLGPHLLAFYEAANRLYLQSVRGSQPDWVRDYIDRGKSETVIDYQRMKRFRTALPAVIRPDVIPTDDGLIVSELDSVPGGMGLLAALSDEYARLGYELAGEGVPRGFWRAVGGLGETPDPLVAVVVSDESDDYRGEMDWLCTKLREQGRKAVTLHPRELSFDESGLFVGRTDDALAGERIDVLYRFFELFDLKNIPKIDLILYAVRKELTRMTPPIKANLEEKLLFALLHHGELAGFWRQQMGKASYERCLEVFPPSWVVDARPLPPHAVIPGLSIGGRPVGDWRSLGKASQKERELVLKPSGYSPDAWGSRGVVIGHDVPGDVWAQGIENALHRFGQTPYVLQRFYKGRQFKVDYYDFQAGELRTMESRLRLCPYFFVHQGETRLAGILATACSLEKKVIHGMSDAVMAPVAVRPS